MPIQITPAASLVNPITALTTDVVAQGPGIAVATIQPNVVDNTKLAKMPTLTIKGNKEGVTGNPEDLTVAQVNAMLGATGGGHTIEQNGTPFTQRAALNFTGAGVTVTDDPGNSSTDVAITGVAYSQNVVTGSRVIGSVYQNTTQYLMFVSVTSYSNVAASFFAYSDNNVSPTTIIGGSSQANANYYAALNFVVLPGAYYKVTCNAGSPTLVYWTEWQAAITGGVSGGPIKQSVANPWFGTPTTSRAIGSIYQNLTGKALWISVVLTSGGTGYIGFAQTDSNSSPSTIVGEYDITIASGAVTLLFVVLPNNYYMINTTFGSAALNYWAEWN